MMKHLLMLGLLVFAAPTLANERIERVVKTSVSGDTIERDVTIHLPDGRDSLVTFTLVKRPDGSFTYDPALQRQETMQFAHAYCEAFDPGQSRRCPARAIPSGAP